MFLPNVIEFLNCQTLQIENVYGKFTFRIMINLSLRTELFKFSLKAVLYSFTDDVELE